MSERSDLLKAIAAAHALRDRAIPYNRDQQLNSVTADLNDPAAALASLARLPRPIPRNR